MHPPSTSPMNPPSKGSADDIVKIEPDHEGSPEDDSQNSPAGPPRWVSSSMIPYFFIIRNQKLISSIFYFYFSSARILEGREPERFVILATWLLCLLDQRI